MAAANKESNESNLKGVRRMKKLSLLIVVGLFLATATVVWAEEKEKSETQPFPAADCPMMIKGVSISYQDADGGAALIFNTENGDVKDLQTRVAHMASRYNNHKECGYMGKGPMMMGHGAAKGQGMGGMQGDKDGSMKGHGMMGQGMGAMKQADAKVENTDRGARLILTPKDQENLDALREHVQWMSQHMSQGNCPKMQKM
jgi:hypothetical protein